MTARLHDLSGHYIEDAGLNRELPVILTLTAPKRPTHGAPEFTPRRPINFRLMRVKADVAIYYQIE